MLHKERCITDMLQCQEPDMNSCPPCCCALLCRVPGTNPAMNRPSHSSVWRSCWWGLVLCGLQWAAQQFGGEMLNSGLNPRFFVWRVQGIARVWQNLLRIFHTTLCCMWWRLPYPPSLATLLFPALRSLCNHNLKGDDLSSLPAFLIFLPTWHAKGPWFANTRYMDRYTRGYNCFRALGDFNIYFPH